VLESLANAYRKGLELLWAILKLKENCTDKLADSNGSVFRRPERWDSARMLQSRKLMEIETRNGKSSFLALKCVVSMHGT
jgi:hypothetical protein